MAVSFSHNPNSHHLYWSSQQLLPACKNKVSWGWMEGAVGGLAFCSHASSQVSHQKPTAVVSVGRAWSAVLILWPNPLGKKREFLKTSGAELLQTVGKKQIQICIKYFQELKSRLVSDGFSGSFHRTVSSPTLLDGSMFPRTCVWTPDGWTAGGGTIIIFITTSKRTTIDNNND